MYSTIYILYYRRRGTYCCSTTLFKYTQGVVSQTMGFQEVLLAKCNKCNRVIAMLARTRNMEKKI